MRSRIIWIAALFCGHLAFGQIGPLSIGAKAGIPLSDAFEFKSPDSCAPTAAVCSILNYSSKTRRYTFGPTVELRLPYGLAVEFDALYNRLNYDSYSLLRSPSSGQLSVFTSTGADRWNFPALLKWRHNLHRVSPFIDGGIAFDHINRVRSNFSDSRQNIFGSVSTDSGTTTAPSELTKLNSEGFVAGGGIDLHPAQHIHLTPELRYTRWFSENFDREPGAFFRTNLNETTLLLGITF